MVSLNPPRTSWPWPVVHSKCTQHVFLPPSMVQSGRSPPLASPATPPAAQHPPFSSEPLSPQGVSAGRGLRPAVHVPIQVLDYNYYGAYGHPPREEDAYRQLLSEEYTFDFPPHHSSVSRKSSGELRVRQGRLKEMKPLCCVPLPRTAVRVPVDRYAAAEERLLSGLCRPCLAQQFSCWGWTWLPVEGANGSHSAKRGLREGCRTEKSWVRLPEDIRFLNGSRNGGIFICPPPPWLCLHFQIRKECLSCRNALALFDMSYFGKFYLVGPDARKAADWLFTADVRKSPGRASSSLGPETNALGRVYPGRGLLVTVL